MHKAIWSILIICLFACNKNDGSTTEQKPPGYFNYSSATVNGVAVSSQAQIYTSLAPSVKIMFSEAIQRSSANNHFVLNNESGNSVAYALAYENNDSAVVVSPAAPLMPLSTYTVVVSAGFQSATGSTIANSINLAFKTGIDSTNKFPVISDEELLTKVQQQTFKYFWDFGHPVSGLARERNTSGDVVTSGGSGFGIMAIVTGISRGFITKEDGLARMQKIASFLKNTAQKFHGAFPHWLNGATGAVVPFSAKDDGADLVETSYLMQGLLTARQYFNGSALAEVALRDDINTIYNGVDWSWFRKNNENVLYWHWSPNYNWDINLPIKGWNECLVTYVLAASSPTHAISKAMYDSGWAGNGSIRTNNIYYGLQLPLGPAYGGPLFFSHYSFLGINPNSLTDQYADYKMQVVNHTKINYQYCVNNPLNNYGYSSACWGLTASDIPNGYTASSPTNDVGVIAPTAALSSFAYTPVESMNALHFFYYKLGDKIWGQYGFTDAFSLKDKWFADSYLAIDEGPIVVMIENYRTGLLWNLFTSCPEVKNGMKKLGFSAPYL